ncbi:hypothetical protein [Leifsonia aquatica]|uniref:hypothetical protein n=1 Tax=Leifsonia aquatica TaxID=144185 RepID=UPI000A7A2C34|nr:hypothetical protein [Leifsonia aquatica]
MSAAGAVPGVRPFGERTSRHGLAVALAHEVPPAALMVLACLAGSPAALCAAAVGLALLSIAYARAARTSAFAREHLADLWAMLLVMVGAAFTGAGAVAGAGGGAVRGATARDADPVSHHHLAVAAAPLAIALVVAAVTGWVVVRVLLARRAVRAHTIVSAVVCGGMLAAMAVM